MRVEAYLEMADTEARHWWFAGRRAILKRLLQSLNLQVNSSILEVGSGTGGNLEMLSQFGHLQAMEMCQDAREIAREKTNGRFEIMGGSCPYDIPAFGSLFDLVCMFDVLEHIEQDVHTLLALRDLLKPGGRILVTVPAHQWLWSTHDEYLHHKRRYSATQLKQCIKAAGLTVHRIGYFNSFLFPAVAASRFKDRLFHAKSSTGTHIPHSLVNKILTGVFGFERFLISWLPLPVGVSLFAVITKGDTVDT